MPVSLRIYGNVLIAVLRYLTPGLTVWILLCRKDRSALVSLTILQVLMMMTLQITGYDAQENMKLGFASVIAAQWMLYTVRSREAGFRLEILAFLLCSIGLAVVCTISPSQALKQTVAILLGILLFHQVRCYPPVGKQVGPAMAGLGMLLVTLLYGDRRYGARNWLNLESFSLQPMELVKLCFLYVGSCVEGNWRSRGWRLFSAYTLALCVCLLLMNDLGAVVVLLSVYIVYLYLHSETLLPVVGSIASLSLSGWLIVQRVPHALSRLQTWRHIWQTPHQAGYQQTQALMAIASGGLWGMGLGRGSVRYLFSADSDMVFAAVAEQWGVIQAIAVVLCIIALALSVGERIGKPGRVSAACGAAVILLVQTILNVLGAVDVLPLTGVTLPFVSNGGSSMLCTWALLGLIKPLEGNRYA